MSLISYSGKTARTCKKWNLDSGGFATASLNCGRYTWSSLLLPGEKFSTLLMQVSFFCPYWGALRTFGCNMSSFAKHVPVITSFSSTTPETNLLNYERLLNDSKEKIPATSSLRFAVETMDALEGSIHKLENVENDCTNAGRVFPYTTVK